MNAVTKMGLLIAGIFGLAMLGGGQQLAARSTLVKSDPKMISCERLIADGPPSNRHIQLTDIRFGDKYAVEASKDSGLWWNVLIPVYPKGVPGDGQGEHIKVVAKVSDVENEFDVAELQTQPSVTGFVWQNNRATPDISDYYRLLEKYPKISRTGIWIVEVGDNLPTFKNATRLWLVGCLLLTATATCWWRLRIPC